MHAHDPTSIQATTRPHQSRQPRLGVQLWPGCAPGLAVAQAGRRQRLRGRAQHEHLLPRRRAAAPLLPLLMRRHNRACIITGMVLDALATALFPLVAGELAWHLLRFVGGIGTALSLIPMETLINHDAPPDRRARDFGVYAFCVALGIGLGSLVGLPLYPARPAPDVRPGRADHPPGRAARLARSARGCHARGSPRERTPLPWRAALLGLGTAWVQGFLEGGMITFLSIYLLGLGFTEVGTSGLMGGLFAGVIVAQLPLACLADRVGRLRVLLICHALVFVGIVVLAVGAVDRGSRRLAVPAGGLLRGALPAGAGAAGRAHPGRRDGPGQRLVSRLQLRRQPDRADPHRPGHRRFRHASRSSSWAAVAVAMVVLVLARPGPHRSGRGRLGPPTAKRQRCGGRPERAGNGADVYNERCPFPRPLSLVDVAPCRCLSGRCRFSRTGTATSPGRAARNTASRSRPTRSSASRAQGWDEEKDLGGMPPLKQAGPPWSRRVQLNHQRRRQLRLFQRRRAVPHPRAARLRGQAAALPALPLRPGARRRPLARRACATPAPRRRRTRAGPCPNTRPNCCEFATSLARREKLEKQADGTLTPPPRMDNGETLAWPAVLRSSMG